MREPKLNGAARRYKQEVLQAIARCTVLDSDPEPDVFVYDEVVDEDDL